MKLTTRILFQKQQHSNHEILTLNEIFEPKGLKSLMALIIRNSVNAGENECRFCVITCIGLVKVKMQTRRIRQDSVRSTHFRIEET